MNNSDVMNLGVQCRAIKKWQAVAGVAASGARSDVDLTAGTVPRTRDASMVCIIQYYYHLDFILLYTHGTTYGELIPYVNYMTCLIFIVALILNNRPHTK